MSFSQSKKENAGALSRSAVTPMHAEKTSEEVSQRINDIVSSESIRMPVGQIGRSRQLKNKQQFCQTTDNTSIDKKEFNMLPQ